MPKSSSAGRETVLVAGGAGFLGSHLSEALLAAGHRVLCVDSFLTGTKTNLEPFLDHPRLRLITQDVCTPFDPGEPVGRVYNLACAASPPHYQADPIHTLRTCVVGTLNLLDLAERHQARFLQASTSEVYGDPEMHPQAEDYVGHVNSTGPRACYDEGKRAAEAACFDFLRAARVDVRVARIFNTYGPRMHPRDGRIVSNLIMQALTGRPLTIYGDGSQTRSFCFVSDLIEGLVRLMELEDTPDRPVNLGNPAEFSIQGLADIVRRMTRTRSPVRFLPLPADDPKRRQPDISRAAALLGWAPKVPLAEGLKATIRYFEQRVRSGAGTPRFDSERRVGKTEAGGRNGVAAAS